MYNYVFLSEIYLYTMYNNVAKRRKYFFRKSTSKKEKEGDYYGKNTRKYGYG